MGTKEDRVDKFLNQGIHTLLTASLVIIGLVLLNRYFQVKTEKALVSNNEDCVTSSVDKVMEKPYLRGLLEPSEAFLLQLMDSDCSEFESGDIVSFRVAKNSPEMIRVVRATPGQTIELEPSPDEKAWSVKVDDQFVRDHLGEIYWFGVYPATPPIGLYVKNNGNILKKGHYLLFSTVSPGVNDSGQFGVIPAENIVGQIQR